MQLAYLVHDLGDPAVARRLDLLRPHLARAVVIGFHRAAVAPAEVAGWPAIALGRTADARLGQRVLAVARARLRFGALAPLLRGATVILSRQFETLALALPLRDRCAPGAVLVQECLDLHRLLLRPGLVGALLRGVERRWLRRCDLVLASSPGFVRAHLAPVHGAALPPVVLVENKVLAAEATEADGAPLPPGPPWRIGWYGMLRCRRSLTLLAGLAWRHPGLVAVDLAGRPAPSAIPDFDALVAEVPGLTWRGAYDRRRDLAGLYRGVQFAWAIDWFEAGGNSDWLLPNRLYEGSLHGAVPIALAGTETARWLTARGAGLVLETGDDAAVAAQLAARLGALDAAGWAALRAGVAAIPRGDLLADAAEGARLAQALTRGQDERCAEL